MCARALQVCIDLFVLSQAYTDIATLSTLSQTTCGSLYHYCPFNPMMDQDQLLNDLKWNVSRPQVSHCASQLHSPLAHACSSVGQQVVSFASPPHALTKGNSSSLALLATLLAAVCSDIEPPSSQPGLECCQQCHCR